MPTIAEVRQKFPQYSDMSDTDLAGALHKKFYSDMAPEEFNQKIGLEPAKTAEPDKPLAWSDVPLAAVKNIPSSAYNTAAGIANIPVAVAKTVAPYVAKYQEGAPGAMAIDAAKALYNDPGMLKRFGAAAWKGLIDRYGSEDAIKKTIATDPVGFTLDASLLYGGVENLASKIGRGVSDIGKAADVSRPLHEIEPPAAPPPAPPPIPAQPPPVPLEPGQAAVRAAVESQPRALTTDSRLQQQAGQVLSKVPLVGDNLGKAIEAVPEKFGEARNVVADQLGNYRTPQNVAADIGESIGGQAEAETKAAQAAARQTDEAAQAEYERANQAREQAISQREAGSTAAAQQQVGNLAPVSMGDTIMDTVRANHDAVRDAKNAAYADAGAREGTIYDEAVGRADRHVNADLRSDAPDRGVVTPTQLTPAAQNMQQSLQVFSERARQRRLAAQQEAIDGGATAQDADRTGISLKSAEHQRQVLGSMAQDAATDGDRRAASAIMNAFDDWQQRAMGGAHYEGDPDALAAFQNARAANRDFRQRFGYNNRNDVDRTLNKIVQPGDQIGPNDISNALTATRADKSSRLLDAIYQATGDHPDHGNVVQAVRGGIYNNLTSTAEGVAHPPAKAANNIGAFLGRREMADRIYSPQDQALLRAHADTLRSLGPAREEAAALAKANRPVPAEVTKGPMQELADNVLGRGQKSDEALYNAIEGYAKSKGGGKDIATLAQVMRSIPEDLRGSFRNTFIRRLGTGLKGDFSPAKFADEWTTKVNPQAKAVLFGDGAHVRALDELADASKTFDMVHRRFGNPSGSGHTVNFANLGKMALAAGTGALLGPTKLIGGWFAGRAYANFLASPAGAASAGRFAKSMQRLQAAPSLANAAAVRLSVRNMRNTATALGIAHNIPDDK